MPLEESELINLRYVSSADAFGEPDAVILPGSKNTIADLRWMRQNGLEAKRGYLLYNILAGGCQTLIGISRWKIGIKPSRRKCECDEIGTSVKEELER